MSACVMKLTHVEQDRVHVAVHLPQRSLYVMKDYARFEFNHEILENGLSVFRGDRVTKSRRVSVICRSQVVQQQQQPSGRC